MANEIEAAGSAVTAGLIAATIEGQSAGRHGHPARCANCQTPLAGHFCTECGQRGHVERSLWHLFEQALHGLFHFDGKIWRTMPRLAFRPGQLTRDYIDGKRQRYVSPLALFLLSIFAMFFVVTWSFENPSEAGADQRQAALDKSIEKVTEEEKAALARGNQDEAKALKIARDAITDSKGKSKDKHWDGWKATTKALAESNDIHSDLGIPWLDDKIKDTLKNPELALYRVQEAASKFAFLLVPISLPFVWLLFLFRRGVNLFDHAVFVLYSLSFMALLFTFGVLAQRWSDAGGYFALAAPVHMHYQLKGTYRLGGFGAFWRMSVLSVFSFIALIIFFVLVLLLGLVG